MIKQFAKQMILAAAGVLVAFGATPLMADSFHGYSGNYTILGSSGEDSIKKILGMTYLGADSLSANGLGFVGSGSGKAVTVTRIQDINGSGTLGVGDFTATITADDQVWHDGVLNFSAEAKFASHSQDFGMKVSQGNSVDTGPHPLFSATGSGYAVSGGGSYTFTENPGDPTPQWSWYRAGTSPGPWYSANSLNTDSADHMITYLVKETNTVTQAQKYSWMLCFEDLNASGNSDWDYNDLVVKVTAKSFAPPSAPLPAGVQMGGLCLLGLGALRARRSLRRS